MNKIEQLIAQQCPEGVAWVALGVEKVDKLRMSIDAIVKEIEA